MPNYVIKYKIITCFAVHSLIIKRYPIEETGAVRM